MLEFRYDTQLLIDDIKRFHTNIDRWQSAWGLGLRTREIGTSQFALTACITPRPDTEPLRRGSIRQSCIGNHKKQQRHRIRPTPLSYIHRLFILGGW